MTDQFRSSRRVVFHGLSALGVAGALAGCGSDDPGGETDSPPPTPAGTASNGGGGGGGGNAADALASTSEVPVGGGLILKDEKVVITQPTEGQFFAFSAECTHKGCVVSDVTDKIECECHHSEYSLTDASVLGGPAPAPLPPVEIQVQGSNIVRA